MKNWLILGMGITVVSSAFGMYSHYEKGDGEGYTVYTLSIPIGKHFYHDETTTQKISKISTNGRVVYALEESKSIWTPNYSGGGEQRVHLKTEPVARSQSDLEKLFNRAANLYAKQEDGQLTKKVKVSKSPSLIGNTQDDEQLEVEVIKYPFEQYTLTTPMVDGGYAKSIVERVQHSLRPGVFVYNDTYTVKTYGKNGALISSEEHDSSDKLTKKFDEFKVAYELQEALT